MKKTNNHTTYTIVLEGIKKKNIESRDFGNYLRKWKNIGERRSKFFQWKFKLEGKSNFRKRYGMII